jgi:predicted nucleotide-binding protein
MADNIPKILLTEPQKLWLEAICSKLRNDEPVSARALKVELRDKLPRDFNPSDIDSRLLRHEDRITLLGIGLLDPASTLVKNADTVILSIHELLLSNHEIKTVGVDYVSNKTKLPEVEVAIIFKKLADIGVFHNSGTNYGHGVDGWLTINIDERTFDAYLKYESIEQILKTIIDDNSIAAKSSEIIKEDFIKRLQAWRQELTDDVINFYRNGFRERGDLAFTRWKERFTAFLKTYNPNEAARFQGLTLNIARVIKQGEHSYDRFMREQGNRCLAFIDDLIDSVLKGHVTLLQVKFRTENSENSLVREKIKPDVTKDYMRENIVEDPRVVFVVHGRNLEARNSLFRFLRSIGLKPLEWSQAITETGKASPFIGEILDVAFSKAQAVVVLMTPDDVAQLRESFRSPSDPPYESQLTGQARPNVLFEAGMAIGRNPDRTVIVELGTVRPFSDIAGRHTIRLSNDSAARQELAQRLETAGCAVDLSGRDWHKEGDFDPHEKSISPLTASVESQRQAEAALTESIRDKEVDRKLFNELKEVLPSNRSIRFIRDFIMGSSSFDIKSLDDLHKFMLDWNDVEHEFLDKELEEKRSCLYSLIEEYIAIIAVNTFPTADGARRSIPSEWVHEQNDRYVRVVNQLHNKAEEVVKAHQDLMRTARHKLEN